MDAEPHAKGDEALVPGLSPRPRWRRPVVAVALGVLMVAAVLYVILVTLPVLLQPEPTGCGCGSPFSLGGAQVGSGPHPTVWFENVSIESVSSALTLDNIAFSVQTSGGGLLNPPGGTTLDLLSDATGMTVATYTFATAGWAGDPLTTHLSSQDSFSLIWIQSTSTDPLTGDRLVLSGTNGVSGTIAVTLA